MIGKRIIFTLIGIALLIIVSGLLVGSLVSQNRFSENVTTSSFDSGQDMLTEVATTSKQVSEESVLSPIEKDPQNVIVKATLKEEKQYSKDLVQPVDLFVITESYTVGKNSRTEESFSDGRVNYEEAIDSKTGVVEKSIEVYEAGRYGDRVTVSIVGLKDGLYTFSGTFYDELNQEHPFSHKFYTEEGFIDEYTFKVKSGEVQVSRGEYDTDEAVDVSMDVSECDEAALTQQLIDELTNWGWNMKTSPLVQVTPLILQKKYNSQYPLPFAYEKVCAIKFVFEDRFVDVISDDYQSKSIVSLSYDTPVVEVGGVSFEGNPADGPLSSVNSIPFTQTGNEIQLLYLESSSHLLPINFPQFSICPCRKRNVAVLTAPMFPPKEKEVEG